MCWQGRGSLCLTLHARAEGGGRTYLATELGPLDSVRGRLVTVSAWVRTRGLHGRAELAHQRYYLHLIEQGATWQRLAGAENYRQACLADNACFLSQPTGPAGMPAKLLLWANNSTGAKLLTPEERPMGEWLRATLGPAYVALGVALGQGQFTGRGPAGRWASTPLATAPTGTYAAWLRMVTGAASWLAPGRPELGHDNTWLFQPQLLREVGYRVARNEFMLRYLRSEFDVLVFLRDSTPARFLP